jgi:integrase
MSGVILAPVAREDPLSVSHRRSCRISQMRPSTKPSAKTATQRADLWGRIGKPNSNAGNRDIPLAAHGRQLPAGMEGRMPASSPKLVFPDANSDVRKHYEIIESFSEPLQRANAMTVERAEGADGSKARLEAKHGFHSLRHSAASLFIAHLGWTPKRLQAVMGHASIQMTFDLYGHLFEDHEGDREAMKKLEAAIVAA